jgi:hypothetical protein
MTRHIGLALTFAALLAALIVRAEARQARQGGAPAAGKADEISGVVTSSKGPEAGVWVIAETTDLPTKYVKIVVTDDQGRYRLPGLPKGTYQVWARGYGLVDSTPVESAPGKPINLKAVIAPTPRDAAKYYPADYWYSLVHVPDKSEFPMKPTPAPPYKVMAAAAGGDSKQEGVVNEETVPLQTAQMNSQEQWIDTMKQGCQLCHQMGDLATRDLSRLSSFNFKSSEEAWATRIHFGQAGFRQMPNTLARFVDQQRAIKMFADWTDRIAAGEVPPAPPRPQGVERNVVITMWDWGKPSGHPHDEVSTDRRHPTVNANGRVYAADFNDDSIVWVDPATNEVGSIDTPTLDDKSTMRTTWPQTMALPSPYFGTSMALGTGVGGPHNPMMDQLGRVWVTTNVRVATAQPDYCKDGSKSPFAAYSPIDAAAKHIVIYDPKTGKATALSTCFPTHHLQLAEDKDNTMFFSAPSGQHFGWVNSKKLAETGDVKQASGWCPAYLDSNGDGKIDPKADKKIPINGYGIIVNPVDGSIWMATTGPTPGHLLRVSLGANPPVTCMAEVYEPPFNNPKMPGVFGYAPRGIDVDRNGVIWTALSGSSQLASFDRRKCKITNGPDATGQHCPEGWTLYRSPGPKMKGVTTDSSANFQYYNWVDQFNTSGLGQNIPIVAGTGSDSIEAFIPGTKQWVVMRVPYPLGFYTRGLDGRIDDPNGGWKGRGLWAVYAPDLLWHMEGGPGTLSKAVKFQIRPNPLAD